MKLNQLFVNCSPELFAQSSWAHELGHLYVALTATRKPSSVKVTVSEEGYGECIVDEEEDFQSMSRFDQAWFHVYGACFQICWLHEQGVRFRPGMGFKDFWLNSQSLSTDREHYGMMSQQWDDLPDLRSMWSQAQKDYKAANVQAWISELQALTVPDADGITVMHFVDGRLQIDTNPVYKVPDNWDLDDLFVEPQPIEFKYVEPDLLDLEWDLDFNSTDEESKAIEFCK